MKKQKTPIDELIINHTYNLLHYLNKEDTQTDVLFALHSLEHKAKIDRIQKKNMSEKENIIAKQVIEYASSLLEKEELPEYCISLNFEKQRKNSTDTECLDSDICKGYEELQRLLESYKLNRDDILENEINLSKNEKIAIYVSIPSSDPIETWKVIAEY